MENKNDKSRKMEPLRSYLDRVFDSLENEYTNLQNVISKISMTNTDSHKIAKAVIQIGRAISELKENMRVYK